MLKFILIFIIIIRIITKCSVNNEPTYFDSYQISIAISNVIEEFYIANDIKFDIIVYGEKTNHTNDIIDFVTMQLSDDIPVNLRFIGDIYGWNHQLKKSAIIFIKSIDMLEKFYTLTMKKYDELQESSLPSVDTKRLKFLLNIEEIEFHESLYYLDSRKENIYKSSLRNFEFFIVNNLTSINLIATVLYSENNCEIFTPKVLNSFDKESQKWQRKLENFDHFTNFHDCLLKFHMTFFRSFYIEGLRNGHLLVDYDRKTFMKIINDKNTKYRGLANEIVEIMATKLNFSFHYTLISYKKLGQIELLGTRNYEVKLMKGIYLANTVIKKEQIRCYYSEPFNTQDFFYLISLNDLYTNYEKLLFPFDAITWILLIVTFGSTFAIIFGLNQSSRWIKTTIVGKGINHPAYNALSIFFGLSQKKLPREPFSRAIFIIFVWFCLIIRTCWQSKMFEFMTSDMRKPLPTTVDDLREMNYTIVVFNNKYFLQPNEEIINGRERPNILPVGTDTEFDLLYEKALEGKTKEKYAFLVSNDIYVAFYKFFGRTLPTMENEKVVKMLGISSDSNNMLVFYINKIISRLITAGIAKYLDDYSWWYENRFIEEEPKDSRKILSMYDLEFGFVIFLAVLFVAILVFIFEVVPVFVRKVLENIAGFYGFFKGLRMRLKIYN
ncbi:hypothetical protein PVAND_000247 [Polypedilum vanderplanki]|uniref:Ionotropic receptor n=1 Tax=Polypedilum vanderplanki TaxID=319348 RepID=A0A9J6BKR3_POLVA|nr:hypothetical protein PVAND_000247 [Polypedilum vanderplanki]